MTFTQTFIVNNSIKTTREIAFVCCFSASNYLLTVMLDQRNLFSDGSPLNKERWENFMHWLDNTNNCVYYKANNDKMRELAKMMDEHDVYYERRLEHGIITCICVEPLETKIINHLFGTLEVM